ncbi:MAG: glutamine--fructose-6-phosphate transaminase (isomerizing) [Chloroflexi bacterium]|nr:glutamine--fructose-6-phosphate transaminase (isomerizing) [Chloroflexota bacterium]
MCGIVGYVGAQSATPVLVAGLKKLEYRGYDSAGIAVLDDGDVEIRKTVGRLNQLEEVLRAHAPEGHIGMAHTRWATHGRPSDVNAHPHEDCTGKIAVVHNGIIENYLELREWLQSRGHVFQSETDTEVLPHLVEEFYQGDLGDAVRQALRKVHGSYAIVVMHRDEPDKLVAARKDSPLIVGLGKGENLLASDIPAVLSHTRQVYIVGDNEVAVVKRDEVEMTTLDGKMVAKEIFNVKWDAAMAEKGGYPDFMLKEIHEQPQAVKDTMTGRVKGDNRVELAEVSLSAQDVQNLQKIAIVACGTAYHAGLVGKNLLEKLLRIPVDADVASEFRYRDPMVDGRTLTIVISQSGETADTLAGLREARRRGSHVVAITNVVASSVAREADDVIYTWAGPEIAVASTKAYLTQLVTLYMLALDLAQKRGTIDDARVREIGEALRKLPGQISEVLASEGLIKEMAARFKKAEDIFFIGRGLDYAVAMEGALKLKEISYIHAEAYAAGELKHGTLALIVEGVPVFAMATQKSLYEKMLSNIKEVKARDATVVALVPAGNQGIEKSVDYVLRIPETLDFVAPVLSVVPLQLFAYHAAKARGCDVDKPRNLAKSVTVE